MIKDSINRLLHLCDVIPPLLLRINEDDFSFKSNEHRWSKKEIIGHLIDSAANNHQRFVRAQFENVPVITYHQDNWNRFSYHQQTDSRQLINFWTAYNKQLASLASHIPPTLWARECNTGGPETHTLAFLFTDYVVHLEHHLKRLVVYE